MREDDRAEVAKGRGGEGKGQGRSKGRGGQKGRERGERD